MTWQRYLAIGLLAIVLAGCGTGGASRPGGEAPASGAPAAAPGRAEPATTGAPPAHTGPTTKLIYALAAVSGVFVPPALARDKGFFREEGFEVDLPVTRSNLLAPGMTAGEIDYAGSFSPSVRNALSGMPMKVIGATVTKSTRQVVAVPGIQSLEQLRGQAIAVTTIGDGPYNSGVLALEQVGIDPLTEVTWLGVGGAAERFVAMQQGAAQASIFSGPELPRAEAMGFVSIARMQDLAPLPESGLATTQTKLESNRDEVKRVLRAVVRSLRYLKAEREGSLPSFMQFLGVSREEAEEAYDGIAFAYSDDGTISERSMRFTIEAEKKQLKLTEDVPFARVADFGPLHEMLGAMGITPAPDAAR
jgi:ABC-type nitrate/sulfonate/bicarbonate transport system substrate-binding protein